MGNQPNSPIAEQQHLETNAWLCILLGIVFALQSAQDVINSLLANLSYASIAFDMIFVLLLITLVVLTVKTAVFSKNMHWRSVWHQYYEDEFLNHINLSGYKWAFNVTLLFLFASFLAFDSKLVASELYNIGHFTQLSIGVAGLCYGLRIFTLVKGSDNE